MKNQILIFLAGVLVAFIGYQLFNSRDDTPPEPPKIAGNTVPEHEIKFDFNKRYNFIMQPKYGTEKDSFTYKNVLVKGFTRAEEHSSSYGKFFEQWLVLETEENRLIYVKPEEIRFIEES